MLELSFIFGIHMLMWQSMMNLFLEELFFDKTINLEDLLKYKQRQYGGQSKEKHKLYLARKVNWRHKLFKDIIEVQAWMNEDLTWKILLNQTWMNENQVWKEDFFFLQNE